MMQSFNWKYFSFYGGTIILVLLLFKTVTAYGDSNLKAPPNLSGTYPLTEAKLPACLQNQTVNLVIEQSGRYLAGELSLAPKQEKSAQKLDSQTATATVKPEVIKLSGLFSEVPITLTSAKTPLGDCAGEVAELHLQIQANPIATTSKKLTGEIHWSTWAIAFTAQAKEPVSLQ